MIKCGLKLWTSNEHLFNEALSLFNRKVFDFIELYHDAKKRIDFEKLEVIKTIPAAIHAPNCCGFHEFNFDDKQLEIWEVTKQLADFLNSRYVVVHPGKAESFEFFKENLAKIDDKRVLIENMAGLDIYGEKTFGYSLAELVKIRETKEICFDLEKAVKSAFYQKIDYKEFISDCLNELHPFYFHISGGDKNSHIDEHLNLCEASFDLKWMKEKLQDITRKKDIYLVFEVPKNKNDLLNDVKNLMYFKNN